MGWKRQVVLDAGSRLPGWLVSGSLAVAEALGMGRWLGLSGYTLHSFYATRERLFEAVARSIQHQAVLYLEFGVYQGASMRTWLTLLKNSESRLHGFDSFMGLPEDWRKGFSKGHFSTAGLPPNIGDPRAKFFKGWFHETLPSYTLPPHDVLVVNIDSDLYLPARYVLDFLSPHFRPGDFLYFDEFCIPQDEARAFREFVQNTGIVFSLFGATKGFAGAVFKCEELPNPSAPSTNGRERDHVS
jgi:hypothetical protein